MPTPKLNDFGSVLIMAGGTGGHVFPALACAQALRARGMCVHWLGTRTGLEACVVPEAGFELHYVDIGGVRGKNLKTLLSAPFKLARALLQAVRIIRRLRPRVVLGLGGFVSGPGGVAAWLLGVPLVIHEQNAVAGLTNRLLAHLARQVLQAFPDTFPPARQARTTGNPVRREFAAIMPDYHVHEPLRVLILGGSLGALALNQTVPDALAQVKRPLTIRHQCGRGKQLDLDARYLAHGLHASVEEFIDDMAAAYAWADLVIARAGALTLSELAHSGRPAILIPYPYAVDDHQSANAAFFVRNNAAYLLPQHVSTRAPSEILLSPTSLATLVENLSPTQLTDMATAARACAQLQATDAVVDTCLIVVR
jgi:UDP-N-acetylglucosamine--N-acetylmuramyl-(pentapeptide) pyrophosphoryl-undecaprenol N-acetylglucosamine transferase